MESENIQGFTKVNSLTWRRSQQSLTRPRYDKLEPSKTENICDVNETSYPEFYSSTKCLIDKVSDDLEQAQEKTMANNICLRSLLTIVHAVMGGGAAFFCMYSLFGWNSELDCMPCLVDHFWDPIKMGSSLVTICHSITYGLGVICILNLLSCFSINCLWRSTALASLNLSMTAIFAVIAVFGGTTLTIHYLQWCDSLTQNGPSKNIGCEEAAQIYDHTHGTKNMTMYYRRLEIQQVSLWALFPLSLFALMVYTALIRFFTSLEQEGSNIRHARYIILDEENTPLISPVSNQSEPPASHDNRPSSRSASVTN